VHGGRDLRHRFELASNFDRGSRGARRQGRIGHLVECVAFVEHQRRRELPQAPPLALAACFVDGGPQRLVRAAPHLVDERAVLEGLLGVGFHQRNRQRAHGSNSTRGV
jgi:hypothetical protein